MAGESCYFSCIIYPDSDPIWLPRLRNSLLRCAVSPLHNMDRWDEDMKFQWCKEHPNQVFPYELGEIKKPHYHVLFQFENPSTRNKVRTSLDYDKSTYIQIVGSGSGYYEYLSHMNNPEKYQYDSSDITLINGFDVEKALLDDSAVETICQSIEDHIRNEFVTEYVVAQRWCVSQGSQYCKVFRNYGPHFDRMIKSIRHCSNSQYLTGEVK